MLEHALRVRDLVHGFVMLTEVEKKVIDHRFFQRLRQVRQNGVSFLAYPSLNTSRFEHSLGVCHVAGKMAERLTASPKWPIYFKRLKRLQKGKASIRNPDDFVQIARLYGLLHDIGHMPLSHLFEMAMSSYAESKGSKLKIFTGEWFGETTFDKPHEALGAILVRGIVRDIPTMKLPVAEALITLMTEKRLPLDHPLYPVKMLVDSDVDADRIDATARDGLLAGGEYGNHDIDRLSSSVFLEDGAGIWRVAYSDKAVSSLEALLFDRYRTHVWIHFHHHVVATNLLVQVLVGGLLERNAIGKDDFNPENESFHLKDDVWLWGLIRNTDFSDDALLEKAKHSLLLRDKQYMLTLWKDRVVFGRMDKEIRERSHRRNFKPGILITAEYREYMREKTELLAMVYEPHLAVETERTIALYSEKRKEATGAYLEETSKIIQNLKGVWENEPQYYVVLFGEITPHGKHRQEWVEATARYVGDHG